MLSDYRIRREARLLVANRLTAVANDAITANITSTPTTTTTAAAAATTATITETSTPISTQALIELYTKPSADVKAIGTAQATHFSRQFSPPPDTYKRSVETQTPTKLQQPSVSISLSSGERRASATNVVRKTAQSTIITATNDATDTDSDTNPIGCYTNWCKTHTDVAASAWCCIGDLMAFCDKYEFRALGVHDAKTHQTIVLEVKALLAGVSQTPFDVRRRFPSNIRNNENLWVCIDRCPSVEYHLKRLLSIFRRPLASLPVDKQRAAMQNFHLAINELRLDISARISEVHLYDRAIFEREFHLTWNDTPRSQAQAPPPTSTTQAATTATTATATNSQSSYRRVQLN